MGYISIITEMKNRNGGDKTIGKAICKDGLCLTTYNNPSRTEMVFKAMKKDGKDVYLKEGIIFENIKDKTKEEISSDIEIEIKRLSREYKQFMRVTYVKEIKN